jgi:hypothetical protein
MLVVWHSTCELGHSPDRDGKGRMFHPAPAPTQEDIEQLVERASKRILRFLERRGVITCLDMQRSQHLGLGFAVRTRSHHGESDDRPGRRAHDVVVALANLAVEVEAEGVAGLHRAFHRGCIDRLEAGGASAGPKG